MHSGRDAYIREGPQPSDRKEIDSPVTHHLADSQGDNHRPVTLKCWPGSYCSNCPLQPWSTALFSSRSRTDLSLGAGRKK